MLWPRPEIARWSCRRPKQGPARRCLHPAQAPHAGSAILASRGPYLLAHSGSRSSGRRHDFYARYKDIHAYSSRRTRSRGRTVNAPARSAKTSMEMTATPPMTVASEGLLPEAPHCAAFLSARDALGYGGPGNAALRHVYGRTPRSHGHAATSVGHVHTSSTLSPRKYHNSLIPTTHPCFMLISSSIDDRPWCLTGHARGREPVCPVRLPSPASP